MRIETSACVLRPFVVSDAEALTQHADDPLVAKNLRDRFPHPYRRADADGWIAFATAAHPLTNLAIVVDDEVVGGIGVELDEDVQRFGAEVGYWLGRTLWGRGIATAALSAFTPWALSSFSLVRLEAGVFSFNPASARVLEKCGYALEGRHRKAVFKDGAFCDRLLYAYVI